MRFDETKPIYLQIIELIFDLILQKKWKEEERIPSIRELASDIEVNPNTVAKAYSECLDLGVIYNKRGIGYFLSKDSYSKILLIKKEEFIKNEVPNIVKKMKILSISLDELITFINEEKSKEK
ncbi:MAG: GntR family transcriptional regulator [Exilispira sp.]|jgi:DNA-binding transcriptional regulator YhcF (GntR family)|nr:GntR family transcriptional regulator [Exilispira sp.]